jgi:hypothetical protein
MELCVQKEFLRPQPRLERQLPPKLPASSTGSIAPLQMGVFSTKAVAVPNPDSCLSSGDDHGVK